MKSSLAELHTTESTLGSGVESEKHDHLSSACTVAGEDVKSLTTDDRTVIGNADVTSSANAESGDFRAVPSEEYEETLASVTVDVLAAGNSLSSLSVDVDVAC